MRETAKIQAIKEKAPILLTPSKHLGAIVHPSSKQPGRWQVSWWDKFGFSGDTTRDSKEMAIQSALDDGYFILDCEGIFKNVSKGW